MKLLSIETSCDETSVAIVEAKGGLKNPSFEILSNVVLSQVKIHAHWGGVVPMMAKREHQKNLIPILKKALKKAKIFKNSKLQNPNYKQFPNSKLEIINKTLEREPELLKQFLKFIPTIETPKIDAIAVTVGPGLEPALWVGVNFAKAIATFWNKPIVGVNHMEGHIVASRLATKSNLKSQISRPQRLSTAMAGAAKPVEFPAIALLVSGGHTELVLIKKWGDYKIIGQTRDDAAGECFDKTARMLELPYPGGPQVAKQAENFKKYPLTFRMGGWTRREMEREALNIKLPRPMIHSHDFDFSFSGLKTAVLYMLRDMKERHVNIGDFTPTICNEIQQAIIDVLIAKTIRATKEHDAKSIILGGGVAANKELRQQLKKAVAFELTKTTTLYLPPSKLTTDNAAMIGAAGYLHTSEKDFTKPEKLVAKGNLGL